MFRLHSRLLHLVVLAAVIGLWAIVCQGKFDEDTLTRSRCPSFDPQDVERLFKQYRNIEAERNALERQLADQGKVVQPTERIADLSHLRQTNKDPKNRDNELKQIVFEAVTNKLTEEYHLTAEQTDECLPNVTLVDEYSSKAKTECEAKKPSIQCDPSSQYRTADGTCNNLENPEWGSVGNCFVRTLPPRYEGASGFRQSVEGGPLPEPRDVSLNVHSHLDKPTHDVSHMFMFFGQLLDHEITQAPISITVDNLAIKCCVPQPLHPQCIPLTIRPNDPFYSEFGTTCISVVRAALCPTCTLGPRQQVNQITSFIDASVMYGTNDKETAILRTNDGKGRMRVQTTSVGDLLPPSPDPVQDQCSYAGTKDICFLADAKVGISTLSSLDIDGKAVISSKRDPRANEHPPLASLQTILVREHNRLADGLRNMNPSWGGDKIFQEARKIVGAEFQHIVFKEYLPITLGEEQLDRYQLRVSHVLRTNYEPGTDPSIFNEFTAAAFRFSHSLINSVLANSPLNSTNGKRLLKDSFFQPFDLYKGILSPLVASTTNSPAQEFDRHLVPDVTNFLYRIRGTPAGLDLASINIHRGRDHGIPTYADMVRHCSGGTATFQRFGWLVRHGYISREHRALLSQNYRSVEDVDLWTGLLSETHIPGAIVGPTAACIIGSQFRNLKFGDRFYYEHKNQEGSFKFRQVEELKKMTLSKLICLNTNITQLSQNALLLPSVTNPPLDCSSVKGVNLSFW